MKKLILLPLLLLSSIAFGQSYPSPTYNNLTVLGTFTGTVGLGNLPAQAANTVLANATASSASPTAVAMPSCSGSNNALRWTSGSGFTCASGIALTSANTFTGSQTVSMSTPLFILNDTSGINYGDVRYQSNGTMVWSLRGNSNSGVWGLNRYVSGTLADTPISVSNSTGVVTMTDGITNSPISGNTGSFTTLAASSTVSGTGFSNYLASPPAIGGTAANAGNFTTLASSGAFTPSQTAGIVGTTTNNNANAGSIGEVIPSSVPVGSAVALTSGTITNITTITLTPGDWDVWGQVVVQPAGSTTTQLVAGWVNTVSATQPVYSSPAAAAGFSGASINAGTATVLPTGTARLSVASNTTVYLSVLSNFSVSTSVAYGWIQARRRR
ncbi:hypothetical protein [Paraburkholderia sp.]|uniref:hypothetical protein n=1 Tax=Paraburkholderia sp. TaxID=1926495 RepID=UPI0039E2E9AE